MNSWGKRVRNFSCSGGFALPTVLIASIVMLTVLIISVTSTTAVRVSLVSQHYDQLAQTSGEAGIAYAKACLEANNGVSQWTDEKPLKPDTDCTGEQLASCPTEPANADCHSVMVKGKIKTTFRVGLDQSPPPGDWKQVASGISHACAIASNDRVYCWGNGGAGQLGNGTITDSHIPVAVDTNGILSGKTIIFISAGGYHTCAIDSDYIAYCWGNGGGGQLGNGYKFNSNVPVAVSISGKTIKSISLGAYHTCAVASDNLAYCWGRNYLGQLGNNSIIDASIPTLVKTTGTLMDSKVITSVVASETHSCALTNDGLVYCWGSGGNGQLGNGSRNDSLFPVPVDTSGELNGLVVSQIASTRSFTCAITSGNAYCWGSNKYGQLGNGSTARSLSPKSVDSSGELLGLTIKTISTGYNHTCVIASNNNIYCWGQHDKGQLGNENEYPPDDFSTIPVAVTILGSSLTSSYAVSISSGAYHNCVVADNKQISCWGLNSNGQLGSNSIDSSQLPLAINVNDAVVHKISSIGTVQLLRSDNSVWRTYDQTVQLNISESLSIEQFASKKVVAGGYHSCAIGLDNLAYCWGSALVGKLGDNSFTQKLSSIAVYTAGYLNGKTIQYISSKMDHTCVVASDNRAYCWGHNEYGKLGNDSIVSSPVPVAVSAGDIPSGETFISISAGTNHTCAITSSNRVYCWGRNGYGQLGIGVSDTDLHPVPVAVAVAGTPMANKTITSIEVGSYHTCALDNNGYTYCWGRNDYGQIGINSTATQKLPASIITAGTPMAGLTVNSISTGNYFTCAIASDNYAYCWGRNNYGQIGDGTFDIDRLLPVKVTTAGTPIASLTAKSISAGSYHTCIVASDNLPYCWGRNDSNGELGNNSDENSLLAVAVVDWGDLGKQYVKSISAGYLHTCVVAFDDRTYCWGNGGNGQLGNNSTADVFYPVSTLKMTKTIQTIRF